MHDRAGRFCDCVHGQSPYDCGKHAGISLLSAVRVGGTAHGSRRAGQPRPLAGGRRSAFHHRDRPTGTALPTRKRSATNIRSDSALLAPSRYRIFDSQYLRTSVIETAATGRYVLAVDLGTSGAKAAVVSLEGRIVATA